MVRRQPHAKEKSVKVARPRKSRSKVEGYILDGKLRCGARNQTCRNCEYEFSKSEYDLITCPVCGADRRCAKDKLMKNGRCNLHGGGTPTGIASPNFIHGRYVDFFSQLGLGSLHQQALADERYSSDDDIALLQTRIYYLLEHGQGVTLFRNLKGHWEDFKKAGIEQNADLQRRLFVALDGLMGQGKDEADRWEEIIALTEKLDRIRQHAHRRAVDAQALVRLEQAIGMMAMFLYATKSIIKTRFEELGIAQESQKTITLIGQEFDRITEGGGSQPLA